MKEKPLGEYPNWVNFIDILSDRMGFVWNCFFRMKRSFGYIQIQAITDCVAWIIALCRRTLDSCFCISISTLWAQIFAMWLLLVCRLLACLLACSESKWMIKKYLRVERWAFLCTRQPIHLFIRIYAWSM